MKLLRILFYQTYYYYKRPHIFTRYDANYRNVCDSIYGKFFIYLTMLILLGFREALLHPIVSMPVNRYMLAAMAICFGVIAGMGILLHFFLRWQFKKDDRYLQIINDSSYDTPRNRRIFYVFHCGAVIYLVVCIILYSLPMG